MSGSELSPFLEHPGVEHAGTTHVDSLQETQFHLGVGLGCKRRQQCGSGCRRTSGGGIFDDAVERREHPRCDIAIRLVSSGIRRIDVDGIGAIERKKPRHGRQVGLGPAQGIARSKLRHQEWQSHRNHLGRVTRAQNRRGIQIEAGRYRFGLRGRASRKRLGRRQLSPRDLPALHEKLHGHDSSAFLEGHPPIVAQFGLAPRQRERGADVWMPRERHFRARREDAHMRRVPRLFCAEARKWSRNS